MESQKEGISEKQLGLIQKKINFERVIQNSGNWFIFIAIFSMINTILFLLKISLTFVIGLGITQLIDAFTYVLSKDITPEIGLIIHIIGFVLDILFAWIFIGIALFVKKKNNWILITGIIIYALDGLLLLLFQEWIAVLFHAYALFFIWKGIQALNALKTLEMNGPIEIPSVMIMQKKPAIKLPSKTEVILTIIFILILICLALFVLIGIPLFNKIL